MKDLQHILLRFTGIAVALLILTGCTYNVAMQKLTPAEQTEFRAYQRVMSGTQAWTYLAKATAAERAAYLKAIGIASRFQALAPADREAVLAGSPRKEMSADAVRFLWGEPYYAKGDPSRYEYWYYLGSPATLTDYGNDYGSEATVVEVYLVDGRVAWWFETVPGDEDETDEIEPQP